MVNYEFGFGKIDLTPLDGVNVGDVISVEIFKGTHYAIENRGRLDLSGFSQGRDQRESFLDVRKTKQFSYTNRGMMKELGDRSNVQDEIKRSRNNERVVEKLKEILETYRMLPLSYGEVGSPVLFHGSGMTYKKEGLFGGIVDNLAVMKKEGVYGSKKRVTYLTRDFERVIAHSPRAKGSDILMLVIDTKKMMEYRSLFPDPESLLMTDEFMRNFVTPHGIPVGAIVDAYHLVC